MLRWFERNGKNSDVVISSRVRLARNLKDYNFSLKLNDDMAQEMTQKVMKAVKNIPEMKDYSTYDFKDLDIYQKVAMKERHLISNFLLNQKIAAGAASPDENISVMVNEEDHIRIQSYVAGMDMEKAYEEADRIDTAIGNVLEYAYDEKYGYLTTCPSNVGTGMRCSYMLHLPALAGSEKIAGIATEVGRFGLVLRSVYGDGRSLGDIYQLSNLITLGISEKEIMDNLTKIAQQIINQEKTLRQQFIKHKYMSALDSVYRSYGILKYARKVSLKDGMLLLSEIRMGLSEGLISEASGDDCSIYQLMIGIQPANLQIMSQQELTEEELDVSRSQFIRDNIPLIQ